MITKTNFIKKMENAKGIKFDEKTKCFTMTKTKYETFFNRDEFSGLKMQRNKNTGVYKIIGENNVVYGFLKITETAKKPETKTKTAKETTKTTKETTKTAKETKTEKSKGGNGFKLRGMGYVVKYKITGEKSEKTNNDFTTRNDLVAWLKTFSKRNLDYLKIYDELGNECRRSAWYEKPVKTETKTA